MSSVSDSRPTGKPGESKNANFTDAHQQAVMGAVFRGRRNDILEYGGDEYDE
jgi:hypothetical protein